MLNNTPLNPAGVRAYVRTCESIRSVCMESKVCKVTYLMCIGVLSGQEKNMKAKEN